MAKRSHLIFKRQQLSDRYVSNLIEFHRATYGEMTFSVAVDSMGRVAASVAVGYCAQPSFYGPTRSIRIGKTWCREVLSCLLAARSVPGTLPRGED